MPLLISYSHANSEFAEKLAKQIYASGSNVWIDRWEIVPGDSIYEKVQEALSKANGVIAILSKESVESLWCRREVAAAMTREATERNTVLIPVLLDDCIIPLFLRDKHYADFRKNFDQGFDTLMTAIHKFSNHRAGTIDASGNEFKVDYSYEFSFKHKKLTLTWHIFQHSSSLPISIYTEIKMEFNPKASEIWYAGNVLNRVAEAELTLVKWAFHNHASKDWSVLLEGPEAKIVKWTIEEKTSSRKCDVTFKCRRMGDDIGFNTAVKGNVELHKIIDIIESRVEH